MEVERVVHHPVRERAQSTPLVGADRIEGLVGPLGKVGLSMPLLHAAQFGGVPRWLALRSFFGPSRRIPGPAAAPKRKQAGPPRAGPACLQS